MHGDAKTKEAEWPFCAAGYDRLKLAHIRRPAITETNTDLLSFGPLGTNCSEMQKKSSKFILVKALLKMFYA